MANTKPKMKQKPIRIYTEYYRPFGMGGDLNRPIATVVKLNELIECNKGITIGRVTSPLGRHYFVDPISGGIVGDNLRTVKSDIAKGDIKVIKKQISDAKKRREKAQLLTNEEFWKLIK